MSTLGAVACGHPATAEAAEAVLQEGGNAFDAIIAAHFSACVAEPVLASPAGGGFLLVKPAHEDALVYDFFAHTPKQKKPANELDFYPITADFGTAQQEFHIGLGSVATPGAVHGLFLAHQELGHMPLPLLLQPAITMARQGVVCNTLQSHVLEIVKPIYQVSPEVRTIFHSRQHPENLVSAGEPLVMKDLADALEALSHEGSDLFYRGEMGQSIVEMMRAGGQLQREDLCAYQTIKRRPLEVEYREGNILLNPPPSSGGLLIAFALQLLKQGGGEIPVPGSLPALRRVLDAMARTSQARVEATKPQDATLDQDYLMEYQNKILHRSRFNRGTTHMSVADSRGNVASLTVSNGEGCGHMIPGTGIMLNNMLGEEDLNPRGFHQWQLDTRLSSMMAPALIGKNDGTIIALGSGGSNRIRSAILQVIVNLLDHDMPLHKAVQHPRLHLENQLLSLEPGFNEEVLTPLLENYPMHEQWKKQSLFFGGVHAVQTNDNGFVGAGDARRGGEARVVKERSS